MKLKTLNTDRNSNFNEIFDEFLALGDDKEAINKKRDEIIEIFISELDEQYQDRARSMQWRLDIELDKCKDSTARFNKMVELFWKQFDSFNTILNNKDNHIKEDAKIINFNKSKI